MFSNLLVKKVVVKIASLLAIIVLLLVTTIPAYALGPAPISAKDITSTTSNHTLSAMFHHERIWLNQQIGTISKPKIKPMRDAFIRMMHDHKAFASRIELHRIAFEADIARATNLHDLTKALLDDHNGFDNDGSITDRNAAIATLRTAETYLTNAKYWIKNANNELTLARKDR
jgi:hypothetical protein